MLDKDGAQSEIAVDDVLLVQVAKGRGQEGGALGPWGWGNRMKWNNMGQGKSGTTAAEQQ